MRKMGKALMAVLLLMLASSTWLPAPKGKFILMLRLYWPHEPPHVSIIDGTWKPPAVKRAG
jgi:hypothetical protein